MITNLLSLIIVIKNSKFHVYGIFCLLNFAFVEFVSTRIWTWFAMRFPGLACRIIYIENRGKSNKYKSQTQQNISTIFKYFSVFKKTVCFINIFYFIFHLLTFHSVIYRNQQNIIQFRINVTNMSTPKIKSQKLKRNL